MDSVTAKHIRNGFKYSLLGVFLSVFFLLPKLLINSRIFVQDVEAFKESNSLLYNIETITNSGAGNKSIVEIRRKLNKSDALLILLPLSLFITGVALSKGKSSE